MLVVVEQARWNYPKPFAVFFSTLSRWIAAGHGGTDWLQLRARARGVSFSLLLPLFPPLSLCRKAMFSASRVKGDVDAVSSLVSGAVNLICCSPDGGCPIVQQDRQIGHE
jgi:hypothetical protein